MDIFRRHRCEMCGARFSRQEQLMHHQQAVHYKDSPYDCRRCGRNFSNMQDMRTHLQREHSYGRD